MSESKLAREQVEALYERHAPALRRFLLGVLRDAELVDEAMQQSFVQLMEAGDVAEVGNFKSWIFKVAFHQGLALRRRQGIDARAMREVAYAPGPEEFVPGALTDVMSREERERALAALAELPDSQREVVQLHFSEAKTFAQIASQLGVPLGTALTRMRLALTKLRSKLKQ